MNTKYLAPVFTLLAMTSIGCGDDKKSESAAAADTKASVSSLEFPAADPTNLIAWTDLSSGTYVLTAGQAVIKANEVNASFKVSFDYQSETETKNNTCTPDSKAVKNMPGSEAKRFNLGFNVGSQIVGGTPAPTESSIHFSILSVESDSADPKKCSVSSVSQQPSIQTPSLGGILTQTTAKNKVGDMVFQGIRMKASIARVSDSEIRIHYSITTKTTSAIGYFTYSR